MIVTTMNLLEYRRIIVCSGHRYPVPGAIKSQQHNDLPSPVFQRRQERGGHRL